MRFLNPPAYTSHRVTQVIHPEEHTWARVPIPHLQYGMCWVRVSIPHLVWDVLSEGLYPSPAVWNVLDSFPFLCTIAHMKYKEHKATSKASSKDLGHTRPNRCLVGVAWWQVLLRCWEAQWASSTPLFQMICHILSCNRSMKLPTFHSWTKDTAFSDSDKQLPALCFVFDQRSHSHWSAETPIPTFCFQKPMWTPSVSQIKFQLQKPVLGGDDELLFNGYRVSFRMMKKF